MQRRIIPILVVSEGSVWHTREFKPDIYLGDAVNIARLYSDLEADEIVVFETSKKSNIFDENFLENLAAEVRVPISYGGGIATLEDADFVFGQGIERIIIKINEQNKLKLIQQVSDKYGSQAVVGCINFKSKSMNSDMQQMCTARDNFEKLAIDTLKSGVGELLLQDISLSGTRSGINLSIVEKIVNSSPKPVVLGGGVNNLDCIINAFRNGIAGVGVSTFFSLSKSTNAPLISYISKRERELISSGIYG